jgi:hypothetical protein
VTIIDSTRSGSAPLWADAFPRLFEIYAASNQASPDNWIQQPRVWRGLLDNSPSLRLIEDDLQILDPAAWAVFRAKAAPLAHLAERGYFRPLSDCFNEIKGYRYLVQQGYKEVQFVPEQPKRQTPDLRARSSDSVAVMEVKTVNESTKQKHYFEIPGDQRIALDSENQVSKALEKKLIDTIARARLQLFAVQDPSVTRRIVYLAIRPDFNFHAEDGLARLLAKQTTAGVEVMHHLFE